MRRGRGTPVFLVLLFGTGIAVCAGCLVFILHHVSLPEHNGHPVAQSSPPFLERRTQEHGQEDVGKTGRVHLESESRIEDAEPRHDRQQALQKSEKEGVEGERKDSNQQRKEARESNNNRGSIEDAPTKVTVPDVTTTPKVDKRIISEEDQKKNYLTSPAVVVLAYNRPKYLKRTLESLLSLKEIGHFEVYVSQDGDNAGVAATARSFESVNHIMHERQALLSSSQDGLAYLAQHYKFILDDLFFKRGHSHVVVAEDDMIFSPDFLRFFQRTAVLLEIDPTIWCISSWNDNGFNHFQLDKSKMFRTQYFPGLGWMLKRELWEELSAKFPLEAWDHWMRVDGQTKGRDCVVPDVSRNFNIGEEGVNIRSSDYNAFLKNIVHNTDPEVEYGDLSYLLNENYEEHMEELFSNDATVLSSPKSLVSLKPHSVSILPYVSEQFKSFSRTYRIWDHPRTHHNRAVVLKGPEERTLILADSRLCPYLPKPQRLLPSPSLTHVKGNEGESCDNACRRKSMRCDASQFDFINNCSTLAKFFPCEQGCDYNVGPDIPNYVSSIKNDRHKQKCLITDITPQCSASHWSTSRVCPCVK
mmetsp:Transcript_1752/g.3712  ORF Transcript_1752/g.3712 Transcript_1752/m.3712 type:complete len:586 (-) Transcript_1752:157-1914(-)